MSESRTLPLEGVLVVAVEQAVAAPFATRQLADLGARVIKVERPDGGDFARDYDHLVGGVSAYLAWLDRGKGPVVLDLKDEADRAVLERLIERADVFVQNLSPRAARALAIDADAVLSAAPGRRATAGGVAEWVLAARVVRSDQALGCFVSPRLLDKRAEPLALDAPEIDAKSDENSAVRPAGAPHLLERLRVLCHGRRGVLLRNGHDHVGRVLVRPGERLAAYLEGGQAEVHGLLGLGQGERPSAQGVQVKRRRHGAAFSRRATTECSAQRDATGHRDKPTAGIPELGRDAPALPAAAFHVVVGEGSPSRAGATPQLAT